MKVSDEAAWQAWQDNNTDFYGMGVITYAERWANLMEARMETGKTLEEVAKQASRDADTEGITGFMYGTAVSVLTTSWTYGDQLRRWHNLDTQIGTEGEAANAKEGAVLNPALLSIEVPD